MEQNTANTTSPTGTGTNPESVPPLPPRSRARPRGNTVFSSPSSPVIHWLQAPGHQARSRTATANAATLAKLQTTSGIPNGVDPSLLENDKAATATILEDDKAVPSSPDSLDAPTPTVTNPYPGKTPTQ